MVRRSKIVRPTFQVDVLSNEPGLVNLSDRFVNKSIPVDVVRPLPYEYTRCPPRLAEEERQIFALRQALTHNSNRSVSLRHRARFRHEMVRLYR